MSDTLPVDGVYLEWLQSLSDWITYEEEREQWEEAFFRDFYSQLPRDIDHRIKSFFCLDFIRSLSPFSLQFAPFGWQVLIRQIHDSIFKENYSAL